METSAKTDRRIRRTQAAITQAFLELLSKKTFERITINDIAKQADVNRGTIYLHYADKYDLLNACIDCHLNAMIHSCVFTHFTEHKANVDEATESLAALFHYFEEHALFFSSMLSCQKTSVFRERMVQIFASVIQKKPITPSNNQTIDKQVLTQFTASAFVGTLEWWILNRMPHSPEYMAKQVWMLLKSD
ncbi:TetR/AcrR family transcriptional regulator [Sporolactobacillus terrae]|uniref:TetR family transcriptional regulator n=1 Tax=Sporolactobacillus terrae TaxID=269673 RepID=A0A5K7X598_9BACL|nr:TetR/AcrR family transcriptional regulator [Sporolactobacillus terrae]BBN99890.1 TetR family transcriptional regulator [Sporolactobacillus terrae]